MKKFSTSLFTIIISVSLFAQQWTTSGTNINNTNTGNVGIGVTSPTAKLEIVDAGAASLRVGVTTNKANTTAQILNSSAVVGNNNSSITSNAAVAWDFFNNGVSPSYAGTMIQHTGSAVAGNSNGVTAASQGTLLFQNVANGVITTNGANLFISPGGNVSTSFLTNGTVGIGTSDTKGYKFAVNGSAIFTSAVVKLYGNWPDYVFKKEYQLPSLESVDQFIKNNHHLPGIPSAKDISENGINLGEMNKKLLEKIEELTLYMIDLKKENKQIKTQLAELQEKK